MKNFIRLVLPYFFSENKKYARWGLVILLILSQCGTAFGYFFIQWNRRFYDAIEAHNSQIFIYEAAIFVILAVGHMAIYSYTKYFSQKYALKWRLWMTNCALDAWVNKPIDTHIEGVDQRIQDDLMRFTLLFERFFLDCFNAVLLIFMFIPLMFNITKELYIGTIPVGWILFFAAIGYTAFGMFISAKVANPLIQMEYDNQKLEAEFRYQLVHARDGQQIGRDALNIILGGLSDNYHGIYKRQRVFNIWQRCYDQFSFLIPFIILGGSYFAGIVGFGTLMQVKATFSRIRNSMAYLLDHYTELTEMIAIARRLIEFYASVRTQQFKIPEPSLKPSLQPTT